MATAYLRDKGYRILMTNYRYRRAEIDILALKGCSLAVVEVKIRSEKPLETLSERVPRKKICRIAQAADHFVRARGLDVEVRFDVILLQRKDRGYRLVHLEHAFYHF